jgi:hypothetical protein
MQPVTFILTFSLRDASNPSKTFFPDASRNITFTIPFLEGFDEYITLALDPNKPAYQIQCMHWNQAENLWAPGEANVAGFNMTHVNCSGRALGDYAASITIPIYPSAPTTEFWDRLLKQNYGFWFSIGYLLFLFLAIFYFGCKGKEIRDYNRLTVHPLMSLILIGHKLAPRSTRVLLLMMTFVVQSSTELYFLWRDNAQYTLSVFSFLIWTVIALGISIFMNYTVGSLVVTLTRPNRLKEPNESMYVFVNGILLLMIVAILIGIIVLSDDMQDQDLHYYWFGAMLLGATLDLVILDNIALFFARRFESVFIIVQQRGFYVEFITHLIKGANEPVKLSKDYRVSMPDESPKEDNNAARALLASSPNAKPAPAFSPQVGDGPRDRDGERDNLAPNEDI